MRQGERGEHCDCNPPPRSSISVGVDHGVRTPAWRCRGKVRTCDVTIMATDGEKKPQAPLPRCEASYDCRPVRKNRPPEIPAVCEKSSSVWQLDRTVGPRRT
ncbi:MAG: hypothetical protein DCC68_25385 [Planctomycetota bacterium]|nr:MAG: hypothetical protein DCC68_25385 [Planctomycetota bacterium]